MNYYPFHVGDYAAHTAHLDTIEDLAYRRMLDAYYLREGPLPVDAADVARLVRLRQNLAEVQAVLSEFFAQSPDGWRHARCDEEIARMQEKRDASDEKAEHERERMRRHRERRAQLFADLRASGVTPAWDATASELQRLHTQHCNANTQQPETGLQREQVRNGNEPATAIPTPTPTPTPTPKSKREGAQARPTRKPPADFELSEAMREWAVEHAPDVDVNKATDKFRDHTFKTAMSDWPATWRNWLRNEQEWHDKRKPAAPGKAPESFRERDERIARERFNAIVYGSSSGAKTADAFDDFDNVIDMTPTQQRIAP